MDKLLDKAMSGPQRRMLGETPREFCCNPHGKKLYMYIYIRSKKSFLFFKSGQPKSRFFLKTWDDSHDFNGLFNEEWMIFLQIYVDVSFVGFCVWRFDKRPIPKQSSASSFF